MATETAIEISRGEDIQLDFTISPVENITGWNMQFTLSKYKNSVLKTLEIACSIVSGPAGTFKAILLSAQTDIEPGKYYWDVFRVDGGSKKKLGYGEFTIIKDVYMPQ